MKNIEWRMCNEGTDLKSIHAKIGNVYLDCFLYETMTGKSTWSANVSICQIAMVFRRGPMRYSLEKAKADAIRLAEELLVDCHVSIMNELESCGIKV